MCQVAEEKTPWSVAETEIIRGMIKHENDLINHRLTWLGQLQGFLFAALGFAWKDGRDLVGVLVFVGISVSISIAVAGYVSVQAVRTLERWGTSQNRARDWNQPDVMGYRFRWWVLLPWCVFPLLFVIAWILVWYKAPAVEVPWWLFN